MATVAVIICLPTRPATRTSRVTIRVCAITKEAVQILSSLGKRTIRVLVLTNILSFSIRVGRVIGAKNIKLLPVIFDYFSIYIFI